MPKLILYLRPVLFSLLQKEISAITVREFMFFFIWSTFKENVAEHREHRTQRVLLLIIAENEIDHAMVLFF